MVAQLAKQFPVPYGTHSSITLFSTFCVTNPHPDTVSVLAVEAHCSPHCAQQKSSVAVLRHTNHMYVCDTSGSRRGEDLYKTKRHMGAEV